ncbi:transposase [Candidatus Poribacteria bacterium]
MAPFFNDGGIITSIAFGAIQVHDLTLCKDMLLKSPHLKPGDMLIVDMGYIDGETISIMKQKRKVDILIPLRSDMNGHKDAIELAYYHDDIPWENHPTRERQQIKKPALANAGGGACRILLE